MAARKISLSKLFLRRRNHHHPLSTIHPSIPSSSDPNSSSTSIQPRHFSGTPYRYSPRHAFHRHANSGRFLTPYNFLSSYRFFSTNRKNPSEGEDLSEPGFFDYDHGIAGKVSDSVSSDEHAILPVRCLIWFLDSVHDLTGMPWWMVIISSTLALRVVILPVLLVQLRKLKSFAELGPK